MPKREEESPRTRPEMIERYTARNISSNIIMPRINSVSELAVRFKSTNTFEIPKEVSLVEIYSGLFQQLSLLVGRRKKIRLRNIYYRITYGLIDYYTKQSWLDKAIELFHAIQKNAPYEEEIYMLLFERESSKGQCLCCFSPYLFK